MTLIAQILSWYNSYSVFNFMIGCIVVDRFNFKLRMSLFSFQTLKKKKNQSDYLQVWSLELENHSSVRVRVKHISTKRKWNLESEIWSIKADCDHSTKLTCMQSSLSEESCPKKQWRMILCGNLGARWAVKSLQMWKAHYMPSRVLPARAEQMINTDPPTTWTCLSIS